MTARSTLLGGPAKYGALCTVGDSFAVEVLGHCGFDWICIDRQHGSFGEEQIYGLLQGLASSRTPALVRVPANDSAAIMRALDAGAAGIVVPMVENANEAEHAASACRYPLRGIRSWGPTRARHLTDGYSATQANESVLCMVMVETSAGLANLEEIVSVTEVDGVFVGPSDLALALGVMPSLVDIDVKVTASIERIADACTRAGKVAGIFTSGAREAVRWSQQGFRLISTHSDRLLMSEGAAQLLAEIRTLEGELA